VKNRQGILGAQRLVACQLSITLLLATIATLLLNATAGVSAVLGGMVSALPNAYFASKLFKYHGAVASKQIVNSFYKGEALKIILSIVLFTLVFKFFKIVPLVFFAVYIVAQMMVWFAPVIFVSNKNRPKSD